MKHELEAELKVQIVGQTYFRMPLGVSWMPDDWDGESFVSDLGKGDDLVEFAGRACYQSWSRPNPATATNAGYINHILEVGHFSVLEHSSVSFYIEGVSRSLTHELVRHRHFAYSQLSQRYVSAKDARFVRPPAFTDEQAYALGEHFRDCLTIYDEFNRGVGEDLDESIQGTARRKQARQAARSGLPNATETKIVMTGNLRAWRHFIKMRASESADVEIRRLAVEILCQLRPTSNVFSDFEIRTLDDGTHVAESSIENEFANS